MDRRVTCTKCNGFGQIRATETIVERRGKKFCTTQLGSGCPRCHGTGKYPPEVRA